MQTSRRRVVGVVLLVTGGAGAAVAVPLFRHGLQPHAFPSYLGDGSSYEVVRYSAPWVAGAIGAAGLGLLLLIGGLVTLLRRPPAPAPEPVPVAVPASRPELTDEEVERAFARLMDQRSE